MEIKGAYVTVVRHPNSGQVLEVKVYDNEAEAEKEAANAAGAMYDASLYGRNKLLKFATDEGELAEA
jgi:hypothetical protein